MELVRTNLLVLTNVCSTAINECDPTKPRHDCEQICVDKADNYTCTCREGFRLMENKKNCTGKHTFTRFSLLLGVQRRYEYIRNSCCKPVLTGEDAIT